MRKANKLVAASLSLAALIAAMTTSALAQKLDVAATTAIAEEAFIYGFPLVLNYKVFHDTFIDASAPSYKGPFNQIHHEARVYTSKDTAVQTPNSDTPYSLLGADLRAEPLVLCMPEVEKGRYYSVQMVDMYTHNYGYIGSRTTGNGAGCYLLAGPEWQGDTPPGIAKIFRCETPFSLIIFRTQLFNPADIENVKKVQAGYKVQTLSAFLKQPAPPTAPAVHWPNATKDMFTTGFPVALDFLLQFLPPTGPAAVERPLREKFASIGIGPDKKVRLQDLTRDQKAALGEGIKRALAKIERAAGALGTHVNGWQIGVAAGSRVFYNGNWLLRAVGSKLGIYGNDAAEATYPFAKFDLNGHPLDGSKHQYTVTFPAGQLPPVNAFWSITMYDANSQFLIDNPINRYLINAPMLPDLKKNHDGSLTIYVQRDSPGRDKESNWLPAPNGPIFLVMRMYWPKETPPSVLPPGQGTWKPPGIVPVANLKAERVKRTGDKSFEMVVRTDERYGHDGLFQGPRGWPYWNYLEYPKPIQNPNLWPDTQSTYFIGRFALPTGSSLTLHFTYPHARYFQFALYKWEHNTFVSTGEALAGKDIEPDPGSINPFRVGANRLAEPRNFTLRILAAAAPGDPKQGARNTLYAGSDGGELQFVARIYLPDQGWDGAGWGLASAPSSGRGLPTYEGQLADGTKLTASEVVERFAQPFEGELAQPLTAEQWGELVQAKTNDPTLAPATAPARQEPRWEKYWNFRYSIVGAFKTPEERARIPAAGAIDGGGDPATQYLFLHLSRQFGPVYVMRGKMPTFPDTYAGAGGQGLELMPEAQTQYWSLVSCEAAPSGQIVDGLTDMQVPLDADRNYTIVYSRREDRPRNATLEHGVAWIEWSPRGEGIDGPKNREDFGMLMMRIMATNPNWKVRPDNVTRPGMEEAVMGPYYPRGYYTTKAEFEAEGPKK
jgi:hypothetical protein